MRTYGLTKDYGPLLTAPPTTTPYNGQTYVQDGTPPIPYIGQNGSWVNHSPAGSLTPVSTPVWITPTLASPWQAFSGTTSQPGYYKDNEGTVVIRGFLATSATATTGSTIFTLPVGYRPSETVYCPAPSRPGASGTAIAISIIQIASDGTVSYAGNASIPSTGYLSMDAVRFVPSAGPQSFGVLPPRPIFYRQVGPSTAGSTYAASNVTFETGNYLVRMVATAFVTTANQTNTLTLNVDGTAKADVDGSTVQSRMTFNVANDRKPFPVYTAVVAMTAGARAISAVMAGAGGPVANNGDNAYISFQRVQ